MKSQKGTTKRNSSTIVRLSTRKTSPKRNSTSMTKSPWSRLTGTWVYCWWLARRAVCTSSTSHTWSRVRSTRSTWATADCWTSSWPRTGARSRPWVRTGSSRTCSGMTSSCTGPRAAGWWTSATSSSWWPNSSCLKRGSRLSPRPRFRSLPQVIISSMPRSRKTPRRRSWDRTMDHELKCTTGSRTQS